MPSKLCTFSTYRGIIGVVGPVALIEEYGCEDRGESHATTQRANLSPVHTKQVTSKEPAYKESLDSCLQSSLKSVVPLLNYNPVQNCAYPGGVRYFTITPEASHHTRLPVGPVFPKGFETETVTPDTVGAVLMGLPHTESEVTETDGASEYGVGNVTVKGPDTP